MKFCIKKRHCLVFIFLLVFASCGTNNDSKGAEERDKNETHVIEKFSIEEFNGKFVPFENGGSIFDVRIKLKNNTPNTIKGIKFISAIKIENKNDTKIQYYPDPWYEQSSDSKYLDGSTASDVDGLNNYRIENDKWQSGETRLIHVRGFSGINGLSQKCGLPNRIFERTPQNVEFIAKYNFIGIDGEYEDLIKIDILENWKEYQKQIGLR